MAAITMTVAVVLVALFLSELDDRLSPEDLRVQQILDGLPADDEELIVGYLSDYDALPSQEEPSGLAFAIAGGIFLLGLGMQIYTAGGSRMPRALAEGESVGAEKQG